MKEWSKYFLIITVILFAIAAYGFIQGLIPVGVIFAVFGVGGLLVWLKSRK